MAGPKLKEVVRTEMHLLICTKDKKYKVLRADLIKLGKNAEVTALMAITGLLSAKCGLAWIPVWKLVARALISMLKFGKEIWCQRMASVA